jgi:hypothetical protein
MGDAGEDPHLEYAPEDYTRLLRPIVDGRGEVVFGLRFMTTKARRVLNFWHFVGNNCSLLLDPREVVGGGRPAGPEGVGRESGSPDAAGACPARHPPCLNRTRA